MIGILSFYPLLFSDLDLSDFVVNPLKANLAANKRRYNLIAVSNHFGGLGGGHYTAFAKNNVDKKWYYFDDSSVSLSAPERVVVRRLFLYRLAQYIVDLFFVRHFAEPLSLRQQF